MKTLTEKEVRLAQEAEIVRLLSEIRVAAERVEVLLKGARCLSCGATMRLLKFEKKWVKFECPDCGGFTERRSER